MNKRCGNMGKSDKDSAMPKSGQELLLVAAEKEYKRLCQKAQKAKAQADEYENIGKEAIDIRLKLMEVTKSNRRPEEVLEELDKLQVKQKRVDRILNKNFVKLLDKQFEAEHERDALGNEIDMLKFWMQRSA
jgi:hypothetical protein